MVLISASSGGILPSALRYVRAAISIISASNSYLGADIALFYHKSFVFAKNLLLFSLMNAKAPKPIYGLSDRLNERADLLVESVDLQRKFQELIEHTEPVLERITNLYQALGERSLVSLNLGSVRNNRTGWQWKRSVLQLALRPGVGLEADYFFARLGQSVEHQLTYSFQALRPWEDDPYFVQTEIGLRRIDRITGEDLAFIGSNILKNYGRTNQVLAEAEATAQNDRLNPGASAVRQFYKTLADRQALPPRV